MPGPTMAAQSALAIPGTTDVLEGIRKAFGICAGCIVLGSAWHCLRVWWARRRLPPGPFPLPIVGNFPHLKPTPHQALEVLHSKYGPLLSLWMGSRLTVVIGSPEVVKQTHKEQGDLFQHRVLTEFAKISLHADDEGGKNVALAGGKYWQKSRRIFVSELMSKKFITTHAIPKMEEEILSTVDAMKDKNCEPFDPHDLLQRLSLNIVFRLTYSERFGRDGMDQEESKFKKIMSVIDTVVKIGGTNMRSNYIPLLKIFNWGLRKKQQETIANRDAILQEIMEEHRQTLDPASPRDFLDVLLIKQAGASLSNTEVMLIAWEFITAGTDTTSATMHWMLLLLANHPWVQKKAHAEIDRVTGGRHITADDQVNLPYTDAVIKEAMRWMPVVPLMVPYRTSDDVRVTSGGADYVIPCNTQVLVNGFHMQRDPANWESPEQFNPDRFMAGPDCDIELRGADAQNDPHHLKFLPMGTGRRACAGYSLAKVELFLQGAALMQNFEWLPPPGEDKVPVAEVFGIAVSPAPYKIVGRYRSEAVDVNQNNSTSGAPLR